MHTTHGPPKIWETNFILSAIWGEKHPVIWSVYLEASPAELKHLRHSRVNSFGVCFFAALDTRLNTYLYTKEAHVLLNLLRNHLCPSFSAVSGFLFFPLCILVKKLKHPHPCKIKAIVHSFHFHGMSSNSFLCVSATQSPLSCPLGQTAALLVQNLPFNNLEEV